MHRHSRVPARTRIALAAALASGLFLTACGGGGDSSSQQPLNQTTATAAAANGMQMGGGSSSSVDTIFDTTSTITSATVAAASATDRTHAMSASGVANVVVNCIGGGTATVTISGGTVESQMNGRFDAGEHYSLSFSQCTGPYGLAHLNGGVEMDIVSVATTATGSTTDATLNLSGLNVTFPGGSLTYDGSENLSRTVASTDTGSTATTTLTSDHIGLAATYNGRSANFVLSDVDLTRTVTYSSAGLPTGSTVAGHHTLNGSANGQDFSFNVSTGDAISYDVAGMPVSGKWMMQRPDATILANLANGQVSIVVDQGNDGTIDAGWTITIAQLLAAAG
jgi:hypothetical protein